MIQPERVSGGYRASDVIDGDHVLYWMQEAVRSRDNHALEYAIEAANTLQKPLLTVFVLTRFPEANLRHYAFLADGLVDVSARLRERGIRMQIWSGDPVSVVPHLAEDACLLVTDGGHLDIQRRWREGVWDAVSCPKISVETNTVVPVRTASPKAEWSAGTFRPKITREVSRFLVPLLPRILRSSSLGWGEGNVQIRDRSSLLSLVTPDDSVPAVPERGGETEAQKQLSWFLERRLSWYGDGRNDPTARATSRLSAYLHFGHISPLQVAREVTSLKSPSTGAFLEQLVVRRELAVNFVHYTPQYDQYESAVPAWAQRTLSMHETDERAALYSRKEFESGETDDPYWNAMQTELRLTGYLHGYLRMYWGKKILEWSETPQEAYSTALYLNNRYQLDGRDPNGYAGIAWCFGKHDRPWKERPVFGMIRYMNDAGLRRKFRIDAYRERVEQMARDDANRLDKAA